MERLLALGESCVHDPFVGGGYQSKGTRKGVFLVTLCHTMSHYVTLPANTYISVKDCERKFSADIAFIHHFQIFQDSMGECSPKAVQGGAGATHFSRRE